MRRVFATIVCTTQMGVHLFFNTSYMKKSEDYFVLVERPGI